MSAMRRHPSSSPCPPAGAARGVRPRGEQAGEAVDLQARRETCASAHRRRTSDTRARLSPPPPRSAPRPSSPRRRRKDPDCAARKTSMKSRTSAGSSRGQAVEHPETPSSAQRRQGDLSEGSGSAHDGGRGRTGRRASPRPRREAGRGPSASCCRADPARRRSPRDAGHHDLDAALEQVVDEGPERDGALGSSGNVLENRERSLAIDPEHRFEHDARIEIAQKARRTGADPKRVGTRRRRRRTRTPGSSFRIPQAPRRCARPADPSEGARRDRDGGSDGVRTPRRATPPCSSCSPCTGA